MQDHGEWLKALLVWSESTGQHLHLWTISGKGFETVVYVRHCGEPCQHMTFVVPFVTSLAYIRPERAEEKYETKLEDSLDFRHYTQETLLLLSYVLL